MPCTRRLISQSAIERRIQKLQRISNCSTMKPGSLSFGDWPSVPTATSSWYPLACCPPNALLRSFFRHCKRSHHLNPLARSHPPRNQPIRCKPLQRAITKHKRRLSHSRCTCATCSHGLRASRGPRSICLLTRCGDPPLLCASARRFFVTLTTWPIRSLRHGESGTLNSTFILY